MDGIDGSRMPRDPANFRQRKAEYLTENVEDGHVSEEDAKRIREVVHAFDENKPTVQRPAWPNAPANLRGPRSESTLANWLYFLTRYAKEISLTDASPHDLNQVAEDMLDGSFPGVKDAGLSKQTIRLHQNAARIFYRYHDDLGIEPEEIAVFQRDKNGGSDRADWGPDDILTRDEIDEARSVIDDYRDAAVFHLLLFTGMRNRALRTLRIKDVNPEDGTYRFNPEEGTKDIYKPRARRPLFGAKAPVRDWVDHHPTGDPEHYLITANSKFTTPDPTEPVSDKTIQRVCERIKENAEIEKPLHPHMLRHNFVYICKRAYEIRDDTIRFYLGHAEDSTIMEQTYSHLSAEDHLEHGRVAAGEVDPEEQDIGFEMDSCDVCGRTLPENAKACPACGTVYTPDAKAAEKEVQQDLGALRALADGEDLTQEEVEELAGDDALVARILESRME